MRKYLTILCFYPLVSTQITQGSEPHHILFFPDILGLGEGIDSGVMKNWNFDLVFDQFEYY